MADSYRLRATAAAGVFVPRTCEEPGRLRRRPQRGPRVAPAACAGQPVDERSPAKRTLILRSSLRHQGAYKGVKSSTPGPGCGTYKQWVSQAHPAFLLPIRTFRHPVSTGILRGPARRTRHG